MVRLSALESTFTTRNSHIFAAVHHQAPRGERVEREGAPFDELIIGCDARRCGTEAAAVGLTAGLGTHCAVGAPLPGRLSYRECRCCRENVLSEPAQTFDRLTPAGPRSYEGTADTGISSLPQRVDV